MILIHICFLFVIAEIFINIKTKITRRTQEIRISQILDMLSKKKDCRFIIDNMLIADAKALRFYENKAFINGYFIESVNETLGIIRLHTMI